VEDLGPQMVADLKATGMLGEALQGAAMRAQDRISELMRQGYRSTRPRRSRCGSTSFWSRAGAEESDEEREEIAMLEEHYRTNVARTCKRPRADFVIGEDVRLGQGGEAEKFRDNLAALRGCQMEPAVILDLVLGGYACNREHSKPARIPQT